MNKPPAESGWSDSVKRAIGTDETTGRLVCGGIAGVCAKTAIAPLERLKMSFQLTTDTFTVKNGFQRLMEMCRNEGVGSLWRGHSANVLRVAPYAGLHYAIHDATEEYLRGTAINVNIVQMVSGALAGGGATLLTYPMDVLRVRVAFSGASLGTAWKNAVSHGGLYQGFLPTMLGIVPYSATAWCAKSYMQEMYPVYSTHPLTTTERLIINASAGLLGQFATYPLDIVRRRMQMAKIDRVRSGHEKTRKLETMREMLKRLYRTEGFRGLSKGYSLNVVKGPITLSISLTVYDLLQKWLKGKQ